MNKKEMKRVNNPIKHNDWFVHRMQRTSKWPGKTKDGTIRIYGQNVNRISYKQDYSEWEIILEKLHIQQVDVACLTEINLDVIPGSEI